jgi:hypothetical protein
VVVSSFVTDITGSQILKNVDLLQIMNWMYDNPQIKYFGLFSFSSVGIISIPDHPYHFNSSAAISIPGTNFLTASVI